VAEAAPGCVVLADGTAIPSQTVLWSAGVQAAPLAAMLPAERAHGVRCVSDRPWVTGAETCELVLALCALGERGLAAELFAAVQHLRHDDGSYWTGYVYPDDARWPQERTTWTAGAMLLAAAALAGEPGVFGAADPLADLAPGSDELIVACDADVCAAQHS
ncbi:MAG: hypothetical protein L0Y54_23025, partial [Sporichthyaceae bacterium]|nr:hypothetical protein [Sporichthyaceae bacterium]